MSVQKIETTLGALVNAEAALRRVSEQDGVSERTKYHVAKLARLVAAETSQCAKQKHGLFVELGVERPSRSPAERQQFGPTVREIHPDKLADFQRRFADLLAVPVVIDWGPVRSVDLPQAKASDYVDLGPLCELVEPDS